MYFVFFVLLLALIIALLGIKIIAQQEVWIVERFGKYNRSLNSGFHFIIPFMDVIAYKHTLKERAINVVEQSAITKDNVTLLLDGIIYLRITNPTDASYGVENPYFAVTQLAQTSMRSIIGKLTMDTTFEERDVMNSQIVEIINDAAKMWGIQCMRYEIRDIKPPESILKAMEVQVVAERQKRADILQSEGKMQAAINIAEGHKKEVILNSEADMINKINSAKGESEALELVGVATERSIKSIAQALKDDCGNEAASLRIASEYINAFKELARTNNTLIIPANSGDPGSMIAQIFGIYNKLQLNKDNHKYNEKKLDRQKSSTNLSKK